jgi:hypothetical protein
VKVAVDGLGNGWSARVPDSRYGLWASADLRALQGPLDAKDRDAALRIHVEDLGDYQVDAARGWLVRESGWHAGAGQYRVVYTAGYDTVPDAVQEAAAQWVAALFWQTKENPAVYPALPPEGGAFLLAPYRRHPV